MFELTSLLPRAPDPRQQQLDLMFQRGDLPLLFLQRVRELLRDGLMFEPSIPVRRRPNIIFSTCHAAGRRTKTDGRTTGLVPAPRLRFLEVSRIPCACRWRRPTRRSACLRRCSAWSGSVWTAGDCRQQRAELPRLNLRREPERKAHWG